jgi:hypothetical protein
MALTPAERWRSLLEQWTIPPALLKAAGMTGAADPAPMLSDDPAVAAATPTVRIASRLAGDGGSVLAIACDGGRLPVAIAAAGHRVTAVVVDESMLAGLRRMSADAGVRVTAIVGSWPHVARNAGPHDVVLAGHGIYQVHEIGAFVEAMHHTARRGAVVEMSPDHPLVAYRRHFSQIHGLERPDGPNADDLARVVAHATSVVPSREYWTAEDRVGFASLADLMAHHRPRVVVGPAQAMEAGTLFEQDVSTLPDGSVVLGHPDREAITLWWRK